MRRNNRIVSPFQCRIFRHDKVECMGGRPSVRAKKIAVDLFLQEERTRLRRWRVLAKFDFYVGITIIVETKKS